MESFPDLNTNSSRVHKIGISPDSKIHDFAVSSKVDNPSSSKVSSHTLSRTKNKSVASITAVMLEENFIRREKRRKKETEREIERMRAELPIYDLNHIRQFKLRFSEALLLQLEETGYVATEAYIKELFDWQEKERAEAGPQSNVWNLPLLIDSEKELRKLSEALMIAEDQHNNENYRGETETLLRVAVDFCFNSTDWFWLGQQLILQCLHTATCFKTTGKHEAIVRYVYAKVLLEQVKDYEAAEEQLNLARELSKGKSWNVKYFIPSQNDSTTLFMNANYLLHICYLRQARMYSKSSVPKCLEYAILAKRRANEACFHDGETSALLLKGQCELNLGDTKSAVSSFNKAYFIQLRLKSEEGMCKARVELSKAYLMHGNPRFALQTLLSLKEMAEEYGFQYYLAQAYRYLGEYYLNNGEPDKATPLLSDALHIFHNTHNIAESDQVRNLEALSAGKDLQKKWKSLRNSFTRELAKGKQKKSGSGATWKTYIYFEQLSFLIRSATDKEQPFWSDVTEEKPTQETQKETSGEGVSASYYDSLNATKGGGTGATGISQLLKPSIPEIKMVNPSLSKLHKSEIMLEEHEEIETEMHDLS